MAHGSIGSGGFCGSVVVQSVYRSAGSAAAATAEYLVVPKVPHTAYHTVAQPKSTAVAQSGRTFRAVDSMLYVALVYVALYVVFALVYVYVVCCTVADTTALVVCA